jgi:NADP-dependent 3-hydroxy acid dehydrogenase YdfG
MTYSMANKVVVITGATSGISMATAKALHARGANVVLTGRRHSVLEALTLELGGNRTLAMRVDVTDRQTLDAAVIAAAERFGGLDVVIANAGIAVDPPTTVAAVDEHEFDRVIQVDLLGAWRTVRAALPQIIARRGHVVLTASIYAFTNGVINAAYATSKAGRRAARPRAASGARAARRHRRRALPRLAEHPTHQSRLRRKRRCHRTVQARLASAAAHADHA